MISSRMCLEMWWLVEGFIPAIKTVQLAECVCADHMHDADTQEKDFDACHTKLLEDIHGAPPGSFVSHLAEIMGSLRTHQKMAELWCRLILEVCKKCAQMCAYF